jgi:hypothetical protein
MRDGGQGMAGAGNGPGIEAGDAAADCHAQAVARIRELLALPEGELPRWYAPKGSRVARDRDAVEDIDTWSGMLHLLARTGRVSEQEWNGLFFRLDADRDFTVGDLARGASGPDVIP